MHVLRSVDVGVRGRNSKLGGYAVGNHNILITKPNGERRNQFVENLTLDECKDWLNKHSPAPIGWNFQVINLNKKKRNYPLGILITGFSKDGTFIDQTMARHKTNYGWYTVRMAKRDLRKKGASYFAQEKVWDDGTEEITYE
jgi:hypothetical protein